jgi:hypothetical protein
LKLNGDCSFNKKSLLELAHVSFDFLLLKGFYGLFVPTCPGLGLAFLPRLGHAMRIKINHLRHFVPAGPAFLKKAYMRRVRKPFIVFLLIQDLFYKARTQTQLSINKQQLSP